MVRFERRGFRFPVEIPKPVKVGEEYDVKISEIGSRGDGIARVKNFVIFVPDTRKGERARIVIKEVRNRFAIGEKIEAKEEIEEKAEIPKKVKEKPKEEKKVVEKKPEEVKEEGRNNSLLF